MVRIRTHIDDEITRLGPMSAQRSIWKDLCKLRELHAYALALGQQYSGTAHQKEKLITSSSKAAIHKANCCDGTITRYEYAEHGPSEYATSTCGVLGFIPTRFFAHD